MTLAELQTMCANIFSTFNYSPKKYVLSVCTDKLLAHSVCYSHVSRADFCNGALNIPLYQQPVSSSIKITHLECLIFHMNSSGILMQKYYFFFLQLIIFVLELSKKTIKF